MRSAEIMSLAEIALWLGTRLWTMQRPRNGIFRVIDASKIIKKRVKTRSKLVE